MVFECVVDNFENCFVLEMPKAVSTLPPDPLPGGGLGLFPAKQSFVPPKLNYEALYIGGVFIKFQNFKPPELRKSP